MSQLFSIGHKLLMLMFMFMLLSQVRMGLIKASEDSGQKPSSVRVLEQGQFFSADE